MRMFPLFIAMPMLFSNLIYAQGDEYDYLTSPRAKQIADLQDDDKDGVINARDRCPLTPLGAAVDNDGCSSLYTYPTHRQLTVYFANDSDFIAPLFRGQIEDMASFMLVHPMLVITLQGYASQPGSVSYNFDLAKKRADKVRHLLLAQGIDANRVKIISYGESHATDSNNSPTNQALQRYVSGTASQYQLGVIDEWTIFTSRPKR